ncbi:PREDICTED: forkhead box protein D1-like [Gekko japonicus]|uniref:Forkhead box protein D1-like n=1 Tax=Gekko japonicus TaxID=146911 RepID=A0ABM1LEK6_GEKJA|nr:PREDICTED: forkhead box protein D1-like [Gekko japonicus]
MPGPPPNLSRTARFIYQALAHLPFSIESIIGCSLSPAASSCTTLSAILPILAHLLLASVPALASAASASSAAASLGTLHQETLLATAENFMAPIS